MELPQWPRLVRDVIPGRVEKPRLSGLTMITDKGMPITAMRDTLQMASEYIDFWKFGFASASVCPPERILDKIMLCGEYEVRPYPGGTSLEIAFSQGIWQDYLSALMSSGIRTVEISDSVVELPTRKRREIIHTAKKMGFTVLTEVSIKKIGARVNLTDVVNLIQGDITAGANYVVIEGIESGANAGFYDVDGNSRSEEIEHFMVLVKPYVTRLIWETPLTKQQGYFLKKYGQSVNLGNVEVQDVIALESLRRGLRNEVPSIAECKDLALTEKMMEDENPDQSGGQGPTLWTGMSGKTSDRLRKKD